MTDDKCYVCKKRPADITYKRMPLCESCWGRAVNSDTAYRMLQKSVAKYQDAQGCNLSELEAQNE